MHEVLYKKHNNEVFLRCLEVHESEKVFQDLHDRPTRVHSVGNTTAQKFMRASFYWLTLFEDAHAMPTSARSINNVSVEYEGQ